MIPKNAYPESKPELGKTKLVSTRVFEPMTGTHRIVWDRVPVVEDLKAEYHKRPSVENEEPNEPIKPVKPKKK